MENENTSKLKAPYASVKPFSEAMHKIRQYQLQRIDTDKLSKWGSKAYDASSIISALKFLDIIDQQGNTTANYSSLRSDAKYTNELARIVKDAYARLFELHGQNLSSKTNKDIADSIILEEAYPGTAKQTAMKAAGLFVWLCKEAKIDVSSTSRAAAKTLPKNLSQTSGQKSPAFAKSAGLSSESDAQKNISSSLNITVNIDPSLDEEKIYEQLKKINNAVNRLANENNSH